jgi:hypothetical protein
MKPAPTARLRGRTRRPHGGAPPLHSVQTRHHPSSIIHHLPPAPNLSEPQKNIFSAPKPGQVGQLTVKFLRPSPVTPGIGYLRLTPANLAYSRINSSPPPGQIGQQTVKFLRPSPVTPGIGYLRLTPANLAYSRINSSPPPGQIGQQTVNPPSGNDNRTLDQNLPYPRSSIETQKSKIQDSTKIAVNRA